MEDGWVWRKHENSHENNWNTMVQRQLDLSEKDPAEVAWPESLLLDYHFAMIELQENIEAQREILKLLNLMILQILE